MSDFHCEFCGGGVAHMRGSRIDGRETCVIVCESCGMEVRKEGAKAAAIAVLEWISIQRIIKSVLECMEIKTA